MPASVLVFSTFHGMCLDGKFRRMVRAIWLPSEPAAIWLKTWFAKGIFTKDTSTPTRTADSTKRSVPLATTRLSFSGSTIRVGGASGVRKAADVTAAIRSGYPSEASTSARVGLDFCQVVSWGGKFAGVACAKAGKGQKM